MVDVLLQIPTDQPATLDTRWLNPGVEATDLEVDLSRARTVMPGPAEEASPLHLLTGLDGSATRLLELATWAGMDWVPGSNLAVGNRVIGTAAVERVGAALAKRGDDIELLAELMVELPDQNKARRLADLVRGVHLAVAPFADPLTGWAVEAYESDDLVALAAAELLVRSGRREGSQVCAHCGRPFLLAGRSDAVYCRRSAPGEAVGSRTCQRIGPQRQYAERLSDLGASYRAAYKRLDLRCRRGRFSREALDLWRWKARELLETAERASWGRDRLERELSKIEPKEGS